MEKKECYKNFLMQASKYFRSLDEMLQRKKLTRAENLSAVHFYTFNIETGFLFSVKIIWVNLQQPNIFFLDLWFTFNLNMLKMLNAFLLERFIIVQYYYIIDTMAQWYQISNLYSYVYVFHIQIWKIESLSFAVRCIVDALSWPGCLMFFKHIELSFFKQKIWEEHNLFTVW